MSEFTVPGWPKKDPLVTPRDPKRITAMLILIDQVWHRAGTDLRLGQLLGNIAPGLEERLFFYEDDSLIADLQSYLGVKKNG